MANIFRELENQGNPFGDKVNEFLENAVADLDKGYNAADDKGQNDLLDDLANVLDEAWHYEFHDFKNKKYATPKVELRSQLLKIAQSVVDGKYDNNSKAEN